ncbi:MAG: hypothetical protein KDA29_03035 [Phycisphaerales bacterium]|nr:hypothetical protein [Phycisphaerales bacterium]
MNAEVNYFNIQSQVMQAIINNRAGFPEVREEIIKGYGNAIPGDIADTIRSIEYESTYNDLREWLRDLVRIDPPPNDMQALYFGLADFIPNEGSPVEYVQFYLDGSPSFDPDDGGEWACECSWTYGSNLRYPVCSTYVNFAKTCNDLGNQLTFTISQAFTACLAIELAPVFAEILSFQTHDRYPIAVGHDSGDLYLIGYATPDGFNHR